MAKNQGPDMNRMHCVLLSMVLLGACTTNPIDECKSQASVPLIKEVVFDWSTHVRMAPGSDNWPITWSDDNHQYTAWGDGGGFGGTNGKGRVSLGFGRIEGDREQYRGQNVWGGFESENQAEFGGKSYGMISIEGVLYAWWGPGTGTVRLEQLQDDDPTDDKKPWNGRTIYENTQLLMSRDKGATWTKSDWDLTKWDKRLIMPTILNFGMDYDGARDSYVYHYFIRNSPTGLGLTIHKGGDPATGKIDLARVPTGEIMNRDAYEFFAGLDACGNPTWSNDHALRQPAFEDPNGVGWTVSATYNAGLDRYILITEHNVTHKGRMGMFEAAEPWGPWHPVAYLDEPAFGEGVIDLTTFYWSLANKWLSQDGRDFTLVFTGIDSNDSWNTVRGSFSIQEKGDVGR
jgi:hypothetical protein